MANTPERAEFWKEFICTRCHYPAPGRLRTQFACATLDEFCPCGCNSFAVRIPAGASIAPIAHESEFSHMVFEAVFSLLEEGKTLEIILIADKDGNLCYVEVDHCANSFPVPEVIEVKEPFHVFISKTLIVSE
jgi:hypothetical protein